MARKNNLEVLIHCDACGEDYSATYKRCPFCGEQRAQSAPQDDLDEDDGYVFDGQDLFDDDPPPPAARAAAAAGGKRLSGGKPSGKSGGSRSAPAPGRKPGGSGGGDRRKPTPAGPINWPRLITFLCSLVIIIAALVIVFTVIYPQLHKDPANRNSPAVDPSTPPASQSDPVTGTDNPGPSADPSTEPSTPPANVLYGLTFGRPNDYDFTLTERGTPYSSHTITLVLNPADWEGEITWSSSNTDWATVDANGTVTNVNSTSALHWVVITVTAGGQTATANVYCRGVGSGADAPPVVVSQPGTSNPPTSGSTGTIVNAEGGLRVRSGPGTTYEVLATLFNGQQVTIVADAGDGWYQIQYAGLNGVPTPGYIKSDYVSIP